MMEECRTGSSTPDHLAINTQQVEVRIRDSDIGTDTKAQPGLDSAVAKGHRQTVGHTAPESPNVHNRRAPCREKAVRVHADVAWALLSRHARAANQQNQA